MEDLVFPPPVQPIQHPLLAKHKVNVQLLRLDLIHPYIGGNKWYKLKYNLRRGGACPRPLRVLGGGKPRPYDNPILTFGGAFSNHILATAVTGKLNGIKTIGIIRGEEILPLNPILQIATDSGMQLKYITREKYRDKDSPAFIESLREEFADFHLIPEGGANELGVKGCEEILESATQPFDVVCCACGTGTTLAGIIRSLKLGQKAIGFPMLKGGEFIANEVRKFVPSGLNSWSLQTHYHFGGYAKSTSELESFISGFYEKTSVQLDRVYMGKLLFGIFDLIGKDFFPSGSQILVIHSGNKVQFY